MQLRVRMTIDGGEAEIVVNVEDNQARLPSITLRRFGDEDPLLHLIAAQELIAAAECTDLDPPPETDL